MIGPEDLEDSPPPADEVEAEKVEEIGEVKEVEEIVEVKEVVNEVEAKGDAEDTEDESKKVEEIVQVEIILFIPASILVPSRLNSLLLKLRRSNLLPLLRMMTLHLNSWSLPLHLQPL